MEAHASGPVDCRREFVSIDAEKGQSISTDGASVGRAGVDGATELASQVGDRGKDAASDDLTLDFSEPDLDLVEPRGIRGREVKLDARMPLEEIANQLGLKSGEIVEDDNLLPGRAQRHHLFEEGNEVATGMASFGFSVRTC